MPRGEGFAHRELSLPERVEQLEELIQFDSLPLRKLKDFLENELLLDPNTNIVPGEAAPGDFFNTDEFNEFIQNQIDLGGISAGITVDSPLLWWHKTRDVYVPRWYDDYDNYNYATGGEIRGCKFVAPIDLTVASIKVPVEGVTATAKCEVGIYNDDATSLLATTGEETLSGGTTPPKFQDCPLSASVALTRGTVYTLACMNTAAGGGSFTLTTVGISSSGLRDIYKTTDDPGGLGASELIVDSALGFTVDTNPDDTSLPSSLRAAAAEAGASATAAVASLPFVVLAT